PSKVPHMRVRAGDRFVCIGPAGGGYGNPLERDPARVVDDIADGLVSVGVAREEYGVVLTTSGALDEAATAGLRDTIRSTRNAD
ncbi:MAG TPA: hydantoinase B/oxoprolinase family protein, partial [Stellaceae bacterium]|nr:hydantoinase B/oxoprolinase family protein [Stellaceae bacterium]